MLLLTKKTNVMKRAILILFVFALVISVSAQNRNRYQKSKSENYREVNSTYSSRGQSNSNHSNSNSSRSSKDYSNNLDKQTKKGYYVNNNKSNKKHSNNKYSNYKFSNTRNHNTKYYNNCSCGVVKQNSYKRRVKHIPNNYFRFSINGVSLFFTDGIFYKRHGGYYEEVVPPVGAVVYSLPAFTERISIDGRIYYEFHSTLFKKIETNRGYAYEVVGQLGWN